MRVRARVGSRVTECEVCSGARDPERRSDERGGDERSCAAEQRRSWVRVRVSGKVRVRVGVSGEGEGEGEREGEGEGWGERGR